jgi:hypothetical protein
MLDLCKLIFGAVIDLLRSRVTLAAEILVLRQQINVLRRVNPKRLPFGSLDRLILGGVCRLFPKTYETLAIVRPDTVIRWHRAGFSVYWRWKSRRRCGRPTVSLEIRRLIREMSIANPLWGVAENPWRASQARHRCWPDQRRQVYGTEEGPSLAGMEDIPSQPCGWHCRNRPLRRANNLVPAALWIADHEPRPAADPVVWGDRASDRRMDRQSTHSGLWLGANSSLPVANAICAMCCCRTWITTTPRALICH